jgi:hypothetical protein
MDPLERLHEQLALDFFDRDPLRGQAEDRRSGCEDCREIDKACGGDGERPVVELSICYCEQQTYPSRPIVQDNCDLPQKCKFGRVKEGYRFRASLAFQGPDERCSNCCEPCHCECVVLARITWPVDEPLGADDIDWSVRRDLGVYQTTVIEGISWAHGATYDSAVAKSVIGTDQRNVSPSRRAPM